MSGEPGNAGEPAAAYLRVSRQEAVVGAQATGVTAAGLLGRQWAGRLDLRAVPAVRASLLSPTHPLLSPPPLSHPPLLPSLRLPSALPHNIAQAPTIDLTLRDQAGNAQTLPASAYHPLSDVVKAFCRALGEETGFSDLYHGGIALDLDASPASIGLKSGEQLFCYCYKAACKAHWNAAGKPEQAKSLRFIKFYFSDWKYGYKTFPIFRHDIATPMEVLIRTFCAWRGLDYEATGFLYSYTYKAVAEGDTATGKALADGDTILAYSRQVCRGLGAGGLGFGVGVGWRVCTVRRVRKQTVNSGTRVCTCA